MKTKTSILHDKAVVRELREDAKFAVEYLKAAMEEDEEPRVLLIALRRIAEARVGIAEVARKAGVERKRLPGVLSSRRSNAGPTAACRERTAG
jgi:DNA-binding phage protein